MQVCEWGRKRERRERTCKCRVVCVGVSAKPLYVFVCSWLWVCMSVCEWVCVCVSVCVCGVCSLWTGGDIREKCQRVNNNNNRGRLTVGCVLAFSLIPGDRKGARSFRKEEDVTGIPKRRVELNRLPACLTDCLSAWLTWMKSLEEEESVSIHSRQGFNRWDV